MRFSVIRYCAKSCSGSLKGAMSAKCSGILSGNVSPKKDSVSGMDSKLGATDNTPQRPPSRDSSSPDNSCAICLSSPENKSFTDSCFHTFCFSCLLEWSKVKAECPLCKQRFKSIVHNVRSFEDYDQYFVNNVNNGHTIQAVTWGPDGYDSRTAQRFRFPTTLTRERRQQQAMERRLEALNWGTPTRNFRTRTRGSTTGSSPLPTTSSERRNLYDLNLWVRPNTIRYREASPEFYRTNPACTHRLIPWLNRELVALLDSNDGQVAFVMELILALIVRYDVRSREFLEHVLPFFQNRTGHFIHEFYCFATSPYDMVAYDRTAVYESMEEALARGSVPSSLASAEEQNREESIAVSEPAPPVDLSRPGPSGIGTTGPVDVESDSDNSDCVLVEVVKPKGERTPVVISLLSSSDGEEGNGPPPGTSTEERNRKKHSGKSTKKSKGARKGLSKPSVASRLRYICSDSDTSSSEGGGRSHRTLTVTREGDVKLRIRSFVGSFSGGGSGDASGEDSSSRDRHRGHKSHHKKSKKHKRKHRHSSSD